MTEAKPFATCGTAGYWEPDEPRGSRPVLRERGGETPPRYSPLYSSAVRAAAMRPERQ